MYRVQVLTRMKDFSKIEELKEVKAWDQIVGVHTKAWILSIGFCSYGEEIDLEVESFLIYS